MIETPSVNQLLRTAGYYCVLGKENGSMNQLSPSKYIPDVLGLKKRARPLSTLSVRGSTMKSLWASIRCRHRSVAFLLIKKGLREGEKATTIYVTPMVHI